MWFKEISLWVKAIGDDDDSDTDSTLQLYNPVPQVNGTQDSLDGHNGPMTESKVIQGMQREQGR